jgi:hypothetical protein
MRSGPLLSALIRAGLWRSACVCDQIIFRPPEVCEVFCADLALHKPGTQSCKFGVADSSQPNDESVIKKAKATIAAKMGDPDSVEFEGIERAARKNALGNSIDTICGFVSDKNTGSKPFLCVVQKDEAYIGGYTIAISAYRHICSITTLPGR